MHPHTVPLPEFPSPYLRLGGISRNHGSRYQSNADEEDDGAWRNDRDHDQQPCRYILILDIRILQRQIDKRERSFVWFVECESASDRSNRSTLVLVAIEDKHARNASEHALSAGTGRTHIIIIQSKRYEATSRLAGIQLRTRIFAVQLRTSALHQKDRKQLYPKQGSRQCRKEKARFLIRKGRRAASISRATTVR